MLAARTIERIVPVGQILLQRALISEEMLCEALEIQQRTKDLIGRILMTEGRISAIQLYPAIAEHYQLPFVNLHKTPANVTLQNAADVADYIRLQAIPFSRMGKVTTIATSDISETLYTWAKERYGYHFNFVITSPFDIYGHIDKHFSTQLDNHSRHYLWNIMPHKSARHVVNAQQKALLGASACVLLSLLVFFPSAVLLSVLVIVNIFYFFTLLLKCQLFLLGRRYRPGKTIPPQAVCTLGEDDLPIYTMLIPLHKEAASIPRLMKALDALDYPKSKLDIKLIVERDDEITISAIKRYKPHSGYELIYVPYSLPQTKPKACNYALHFARGKYVTIYDAEDIPDPLQLKKSVYWFSRQPEEVVCLQARLNYYNRNDSLLTRLFAIEYAAWFDFMLPGLRHLRIPIPLGGTSNHFRLDKLRELGEWDPYNVTEDADLGVRLALQHYETDLLDSLTAEEAPIQIKAWLNQRTRWIRGYMQTWLVHMRHPLELKNRLDATAFWGFQFFVGGPCLVFLSAPILWVICALWLGGIISINNHYFSSGIMGLALFNLLFGLIAHIGFAMVIIRRYRWQNMRSALYAFPLYWLLHSLASFKALWQLAVAPHIWEKTPHGLSEVTDAQRLESLRYMQ